MRGSKKEYLRSHQKFVDWFQTTKNKSLNKKRLTQEVALEFALDVLYPEDVKPDTAIVIWSHLKTTLRAYYGVDVLHDILSKKNQNYRMFTYALSEIPISEL